MYLFKNNFIIYYDYYLFESMDAVIRSSPLKTTITELYIYTSTGVENEN